MSVIVKGMEMPVNCDSCPAGHLWDDGSHNCRLQGGLWMDYLDTKEGRHSDCPLRPLPEKHGRLIDADEATRGSLERTGKRLLAIDTAPTIVEAEE